MALVACRLHAKQRALRMMPLPLPGACARAVCGAQAAVDSRGPACPLGPPLTDKPADACRLV